MTTDLESSLREAFHQGADALPHTVDPWTRTTTAVRRSQARRRTAALALAASALVVGVGVATLGVPSFRADGAGVARTPDAADVQVTTDDVTTWPTRGELAGDAGFLARARTALGADGVTVGRVLFAGSVGSQRVAIATITGTQDGSPVDDVRAAVEPADGSSSWPFFGYPRSNVQGVLSLVLQDGDGSADLLVLARTDVRNLAWSRAATYDDQGRPQRTYSRLSAVDGVARAQLDPGPVTTISVRADRTSSGAAPESVQLLSSDLVSETASDAVFSAASKDARCAGVLDANDVRNATADVSGNRDPLNPPAAIEAIWCRQVPGGVVGLFGVTLQDGTTFQAQLLEGRQPSGTLMVQSVGRPVPRGAARVTPAVLNDVPREGSVDNQRFFVNAPGAARVDVVVDDGTGPKVFARVQPDRDGFAEVRLTDGQAQSVVGAPLADAVLRDAAGKELGRVALSSAQAVQDLDWSVDGPIS